MCIYPTVRDTACVRRTTVFCRQRKRKGTERLQRKDTLVAVSRMALNNRKRLTANNGAAIFMLQIMD